MKDTPAIRTKRTAIRTEAKTSPTGKPIATAIALLVSAQDISKYTLSKNVSRTVMYLTLL